MAKKTIIFWRDIPSQVVVKEGRTKAKTQLSKRFMVAIDRAAMRAGRQGVKSTLKIGGGKLKLVKATCKLLQTRLLKNWKPVFQTKFLKYLLRTKA